MIMNQHLLNAGARDSFIGGTLSCMLLVIHAQDISGAAILAAVGAVSSFATAMCLRFLARKIRGR